MSKHIFLSKEVVFGLSRRQAKVLRRYTTVASVFFVGAAIHLVGAYFANLGTGNVDPKGGNFKLFLTNAAIILLEDFV